MKKKKNIVINMYIYQHLLNIQNLSKLKNVFEDKLYLKLTEEKQEKNY